MARNGKTAPAGNGSTQSVDTLSQDALGLQGVQAARGMMSTSLASLAGVVDWMEQMQALSGRALSGWSQALELCSRDLEQTSEPGQLMALPAKMVNHQMEQTSRQLGKAMQDLLEAQAKWAERWRRQLADQVQQAAGLATEGAGAPGGLQSAPVAAIGQLQDQWLAMTRKWIEAMATAVPAQTESSGR